MKVFSMSQEPDIITREKKMVEAMVKIFCKNHHNTNDSLCSECFEIRDYALKRLENCPYQDKKPVCGKCGLTCYNKKFRDKTEKMFIYSGPRMFFQHPILGIQHICDSFKNKDQVKKS